MHSSIGPTIASACLLLDFHALNRTQYDEPNTITHHQSPPKKKTNNHRTERTRRGGARVCKWGVDGVLRRRPGAAAGPFPFFFCIGAW